MGLGRGTSHRGAFRLLNQRMHRHIKYDDITAKAKASKASKCAGVLGYAYDFASLPALVAPLVAPAFPLRLQFLDDPATQKWESKLQCTKIVTVDVALGSR